MLLRVIRNFNLPFQRCGRGPTLVLVHGYLGGSEQWVSELTNLSSFFDVIAVNLAGYGNAHALQAPTQIAEHATAVLATLDELGVTSFHLLGHSMGGMVAQQIVHQASHRVDRLVLYGTGALGLIPGRFETMARSRERLVLDGLEHTARRISAMWLLEREASGAFEALARLACTASSQAAQAGLWAMESWDGRDWLPAINQTTLVIWGEHDRSYAWPQVEALWRGIKGSSLAVLPACSHCAHLERPELFQLLVQEFLLSGKSLSKKKGYVFT